MSIITARSIGVRRGRRVILSDVSFDLREGESLGMIGPNGAGKSTLLRVMAGLLAPDTGAVHLDARPIGAWKPRERARRLAYLPQDAVCHWPIAAERLVALGRLPHLAPWQRLNARDAVAVRAAMRLTEVEALAAQRVDTLSGGERARVLLARALAGEPAILLADEPVADLDPYHRLDVMAQLRNRTRAGTAVVVVMHDLTLAARFCDRLLLLDQGRVVALGPPHEVLTAERLAATYRIEALHGDRGGEPYVLPWSLRPSEKRPP